MSAVNQSPNIKSSRAFRLTCQSRNVCPSTSSRHSPSSLSAGLARKSCALAPFLTATSVAQSSNTMLAASSAGWVRATTIFRGSMATRNRRFEPGARLAMSTSVRTRSPRIWNTESSEQAARALTQSKASSTGFTVAHFAFGRPRFNLPTGTSQFVSPQRGQPLGRPSIRLIHWWRQRRHLQIMLAGITITSFMVDYFPLDINSQVWLTNYEGTL